ncbi:hypothetical protein K474DRAFT_1049566 [Panus rudis PR-1116 ss-1]|nr:hypothetical protein K474DRAFT_1049566 [Panus rudis PR-1116 ss-1]
MTDYIDVPGLQDLRRLRAPSQYGRPDGSPYGAAVNRPQNQSSRPPTYGQPSQGYPQANGGPPYSYFPSTSVYGQPDRLHPQSTGNAPRVTRLSIHDTGDTVSSWNPNFLSPPVGRPPSAPHGPRPPSLHVSAPTGSQQYPPPTRPSPSLRPPQGQLQPSGHELPGAFPDDEGSLLPPPRRPPLSHASNYDTPYPGPQLISRRSNSGRHHQPTYIDPSFDSRADNRSWISDSLYPNPSQKPPQTELTNSNDSGVEESVRRTPEHPDDSGYPQDHRGDHDHRDEKSSDESSTVEEITVPATGLTPSEEEEANEGRSRHSSRVEHGSIDQPMNHLGSPINRPMNRAFSPTFNPRPMSVKEGNAKPVTLQEPKKKKSYFPGGFMTTIRRAMTKNDPKPSGVAPTSHYTPAPLQSQPPVSREVNHPQPEVEEVELRKSTATSSSSSTSLSRHTASSKQKSEGHKSPMSPPSRAADAPVEQNTALPNPHERPVSTVDPATIASPVAMEPLPTRDYRRMGERVPISYSYDYDDDALSSHFNRIGKFFRDLYDLPWISRRITEDYDLSKSSRAQYGKVKGSWYQPPGHEKIDLLETPVAMSSPTRPGQYQYRRRVHRVNSPTRPVRQRLHRSSSIPHSNGPTISRPVRSPASATSGGNLPSPGVSSHGHGVHNMSTSYYYPGFPYYPMMVPPKQRSDSDVPVSPQVPVVLWPGPNGTLSPVRFQSPPPGHKHHHSHHHHHHSRSRSARRPRREYNQILEDSPQLLT